MAEVYANIEDILARHPGIRLEVRRTTLAGLTRARARLARHFDTGASFVDVTFGDVDGFLNLNDPGGNALSIEWGRGAYNHPSGARIGAMTGLNIVRGAF